VKATANKAKSHDSRLERLAANIEALAEKDEIVMRHARNMVTLRRAAAAELYSICEEFVQAVNRLLTSGQLGLDPPEFPAGAFQEHISNLIQINIRGRILQVEFEATPDLVSTEDFRIPYTLQGYVRAFNQALLDKDLIEEQLIFYTLEKDQKLWRFFDARTYRSGPFDQDYLISLMEQLL
jgi:hypothetical protein